MKRDSFPALSVAAVFFCFVSSMTLAVPVAFPGALKVLQGAILHRRTRRRCLRT